MVLPVLGLLAAGGAYAGQGPINDFLAERRGEAFKRSGADFSGMGEAGIQAQRMAEAGILGPSLFGGLGGAQNMQLLQQAFGQQQADAANATRIQSAQISAGPAYMNAQLNQRKFEHDLNSQKQYEQALIAAGMDPMWAGTPMQNAYAQQYGVQSEDFRYAGMDPDQIAEAKFQESLGADLAQVTAIADMADANNRIALADSNREAQLMQNEATMNAPQLQALERQNAFLDQAQPISDQVAGAEWALKNLSTKLFDSDWLTDTQNLQTRDSMNRLLFAQRMQYVRDTYGDAEPPPAVMEQIAAMFPLIEGTVQDQKAMARVRANLEAMRNSGQDRLTDLQRNNPGFAAPPPRNSLPTGWSSVGQQ